MNLIRSDSATCAHKMVIRFFQLSLLSLFFVVPALFVISHHTFSNWDHPELEEFIKSKGISGRIYIEGARPYFIRRSSNNGSVYFYDLNPRVKEKESISQYELIDQCFAPDYWIITRIYRTQDLFNFVQTSFSDLILTGNDIFISKKLKIKKGERPTIDCKNLKMKG